MTKERREELRAALTIQADPWHRTSILVQESAGIYSNPILQPDELRALLDSDERLGHVKQWLERYSNSAGSEHASGFASCAAMALVEIEAGVKR